MLLTHQERISAWGSPDKLSIIKVEQLLTRQGVNVGYRTLRWCPWAVDHTSGL